MPSYQFAELLIDNLLAYLAILTASLFVHYIFYRKLCVGWLDPVAFSIFAASLAFPVGLFVILYDDSSYIYLFNFLLSEVFFWVGVFLFAPRIERINEKICSLKKIVIPKGSVFVFYSIFLLFLALKICQFYFVGIPLFAVIRIGMATDTGGLGIFETISTALFPIILFNFYFLIFEGLIKKINYISITIILITILFLNGSKSILVPIVQFMYIAALFFYGSNKFSRINKIGNNFSIPIIILLILSALLNIYIKEDDLLVSIILLVERFIGYGDVYYMSFPNNIIDSINIGSFGHVLFNPILTTLRINLVDTNFLSYGASIMQYVQNNFDGGGPNARQNLLAYYFLREYGFLFSFFAGSTVGLLRKFILSIRSNYYNIYFIFILSFVGCAVFFTDIPYSISLSILNIIFFCIWILYSKLVTMMLIKNIRSS